MRRRACVATVLIIATCWGFYVAAPEATVEALGAKAADAQAMLRAHGVSLARTVGDRTAASAHLIHNLYLEVLTWYHTKMGDHVHAVAAMASMASHTLRERVGNAAQYVNEFQNVTTHHAAELKEWLRSDEPRELATQLRVTAMSAMYSARIRAVVELQELQGWCRSASIEQLIVVAVAFVLSLVVIAVVARGMKRVCCRRRRELLVPRVAAEDAVLVDEMDMQTSVMMAPTPLRSPRLPTSQPPSVPRRRRTESPAPLAKSADSMGNAAPIDGTTHATSEEDLLWRLNTSSSDALRSLAGLGDKSVEKIAKFRSKQGDIECMNDLVTKVGIHRATFTNFAKAQGL